MAITKKNQVTITVERKNRTKDNAGGYTDTWSAITGSPFAGRHIRTSSINSLEPFTDGQPMSQAVMRDVLVFPTKPTILKEDRCTVGTKVYRVLEVRTYSRTVQADVEVYE